MVPTLPLNWVNLKIISAAAFQIIGLGKLSRNEFLLLGWIYCSIRIMMVLYSTLIRQLQEMLWEHLLKAESCTCHKIIWVLQRQLLWQCVRLLSTYMHADEDKLRQQKQFKSPVCSIYIKYSTACRHCKYS